MKRVMLIVLLLILLIPSITLTAQNRSSELTDVCDNLVRLVHDRFSDWSHNSITPIQGSRDVALEQYTLDGKVVSVTIIRHSSREEAVDRIRQFAIDMRADRKTPDAGEEQYSLAAHGSTIFRIRHFTVNIDARDENSTGRKEEKKLIKEFSRLVGDAIK